RRDARVVLAGEDQERRLAVLRVVDRAALEEELPGLPGVEAVVHAVVLGRAVRHAHHRDQVAHAEAHHAGGELLRVVGAAPAGRVAAVAAAGDADLLLVGDAGAHQRLDAVDHVVELLPRRILVVEHAERDAASRAAAIVGIEDGVALGGGDLAGIAVVGEPAVAV